MRTTLEQALRALADSGRLRDRLPYPRAVLLAAFASLPDVSAAEAGALFVALRALPGGAGSVGGVRVTALGAKRGRAYVFAGLGGDAEAPAEPPDLSNAPRLRVPSSRAAVPASLPGPAASGAKSTSLDIHFGDNLPILATFPDSSFDLIYIDPPFNTGKSQARTRIQTVHDEEGGDRVGFAGRRYKTIRIGTAAFDDTFDDFLGFLEPRLRQAHRLLKPTASFFLHIDYREVHYCKVLLDAIFGRDCFINEIIWSYDYGARATRRWSPKHDNILWYARDPDQYCFDFEAMDRIPYMAPGLVGEEKAARGKTPTDVWWNTIVPTNGRERTGYPTQKPLAIMERIVRVHSRPGDRLLDFFAGSGTLGEAALRHGRSVVLVDENPEAMRVMSERLAQGVPRWHGWEPAELPREESIVTSEPAPELPAPGRDGPGQPVPRQQSLFG